MIVTDNFTITTTGGGTTCTNAPPGLVSWWRAENNGTDFVGANTAIATNGATFVAGKVGQAFSLTNSHAGVIVLKRRHGRSNVCRWRRRDFFLRQPGIRLWIGLGWHVVPDQD
ncbi:MAG: hypothetical protein DME26_03980 [Verrucomicrobia bacterium]|nr:MAG: hypothetical protein DME26_03980 [Verrucomicrobiota bacterium]